MRVSVHAEQGERDRIERAAHFHMAIGCGRSARRSNVSSF
jgi:hypothetical protein